MSWRGSATFCSCSCRRRLQAGSPRARIGTAFFQWASVHTQRRCLAAGADATAVDEDGWTPLHHAARFADALDVFAMLVANSPVRGSCGPCFAALYEPGFFEVLFLVQQPEHGRTSIPERHVLRTWLHLVLDETHSAPGAGRPLLRRGRAVRRFRSRGGRCKDGQRPRPADRRKPVRDGDATVPELGRRTSLSRRRASLCGRPSPRFSYKVHSNPSRPSIASKVNWGTSSITRP